VTDFRFYRHRDYGLVREDSPPSGYFEGWLDIDDDPRPGLWHHISFDHFSASMSPISEDEARELCAGDIRGPAEDERYARQLRERLARV
jgi:hypothetical protein